MGPVGCETNLTKILVFDVSISMIIRTNYHH
jgi:hypothetical protein